MLDEFALFWKALLRLASSLENVIWGIDWIFIAF
jgi:hypothetical protein